MDDERRRPKRGAARVVIMHGAEKRGFRAAS